MSWSRGEAGCGAEAEQGDAAGSGAGFRTGGAGNIWLGGVGRAVVVEGRRWVVSLVIVWIGFVGSCCWNILSHDLLGDEDARFRFSNFWRWA